MTRRGRAAAYPEDAFEPSYLNFLPINGAVLVPQFGDPNDAQALKDIQAAYPDREVIGIMTREVIYGGGNIHCIAAAAQGALQVEAVARHTG